VIPGERAPIEASIAQFVALELRNTPASIDAFCEQAFLLP
jgi:hypothetical protein